MKKAVPAPLADPVDIYVGSQVRFRRKLLHISQEKLASAMGLTFQQIQKYERGANRISASRLYKVAQLLGVPVSFFFTGYEGDVNAKSFSLADEKDTAYGIQDDQSAIESLIKGDDPMDKQETMELVYHYYRLDEAARAHVLGLVKSMNGTVPKKNNI